MIARTKELSQLEKKRVRTAKVVILLALMALAVLAVFQWVESSSVQNSPFAAITAMDLVGGEGDVRPGEELGALPEEVVGLQPEEVVGVQLGEELGLQPKEGAGLQLEEEVQAPVLTVEAEGARDPLSLDQVGIAFMQMNEGAGILWYQSSWDNAQSRILFERALVHKGWRAVSDTSETILSFEYPPSATAAGGILFATFHSTEQGCSIVVELM